MRKLSVPRFMLFLAMVASVIGLATCAGHYTAFRTAKRAAEDQRKLDGMLQKTDAPGATAPETASPPSIEIGDRFHAYGTVLSARDIIGPKTFEGNFCDMDPGQDALVAEKIVDGYVRVSYRPQRPTSIEGNEECPVGTAFMIPTERLLVWKRVSERERFERAQESDLKRRLEEP